MADPVLHVVAGPNGAGKTTFYAKVLGPATRLASDERARRMREGQSFVTETVFSHESKVALLVDAERVGYRVTLHIVLIPEELAVARVANRVSHGGHHVPEDKVRARFRRLWGHLRAGIELVDEARVYDNTKAGEPFQLVATYHNGRLTGAPRWPPWAPTEVREAGR